MSDNLSTDEWLRRQYRCAIAVAAAFAVFGAGVALVTVSVFSNLFK